MLQNTMTIKHTERVITKRTVPWVQPGSFFLPRLPLPLPILDEARPTYRLPESTRHAVPSPSSSTDDYCRHCGTIFSSSSSSRTPVFVPVGHPPTRMTTKTTRLHRSVSSVWLLLSLLLLLIESPMVVRSVLEVMKSIDNAVVNFVFGLVVVVSSFRKKWCVLLGERIRWFGKGTNPTTTQHFCCNDEPS